MKYLVLLVMLIVSCSILDTGKVQVHFSDSYMCFPKEKFLKALSDDKDDDFIKSLEDRR